MTNFILFIIILNILVVIYNLYMWFKVGIENESLKKENKMYNKDAVNKKDKRIDMLYRENVNLEFKIQELEELIKYQQNLLNILAKRKD